MDKPIKVLLIEDNPGDARLIQEMLARATSDRFDLECAEVLLTGLERLSVGGIDLVLLDLSLPDSLGFDTFAKVYVQAPQVPIIVLTGLDDEALAVMAVREGAQDYLVKGQTDINLLVRAIYYAIERKRIEKALRDSEERYRTLIQQSVEAICIFDPETKRVLEANPAFLRLLGYTADEVQTLTVYDFIARDRENVDEDIQDIVTSGATAVGETVWQYKEGYLIDVQVTASTIPQEGKDIVFVVARDITERKRMEEERQKASKLESLGILAGGIAHDFNNILTAILGNISLARTYTDLSDTVSERLTDAEKASLRAKDLTQQLLTFSKGGAPVKKTASIRELIKDSATFVTRGSNVRCEFSLPDDLWPAEVDEGQISQVIQNLVINASQAMPEGGVIQVRAENIAAGAQHSLPLKEGKYVKMYIEDHGFGIPHEDLPRIFDPYFTTKKKGNGLGLTTSYSIIKNHDGYLTVDSRLGIGTTFYVYLRASEEAMPPKEVEEETPLLEKGKILLMDDEEIVREVVGEMLNRIGYEVAFAEDGTEAIEAYIRARESGYTFDAVIMDLTVPGGMGGRETIHRLIEIDPEVRAIVSSGYSNDPIMANFKEHQFKGVIAKPYTAQKLNEVLHKVITDGKD